MLTRRKSSKPFHGPFIRLFRAYRAGPSAMRPNAIVVGAGPVGLATTLELARLGKSVRIFTADAAPTTESRATGVLPRTLDWLELTGCHRADDRCRREAQGRARRQRRQDPRAHRRDATRLKRRFNFMLSLPQSRTEAILTACIGKYGVEVERGHSVTGITLLADGAEALVTSAQECKTVTADWLIGADGAHSTVRKKLAINFPRRGLSLRVDVG